MYFYILSSVKKIKETNINGPCQKSVVELLCESSHIFLTWKGNIR